MKPKWIDSAALPMQAKPSWPLEKKIENLTWGDIIKYPHFHGHLPRPKPPRKTKRKVPIVLISYDKKGRTAQLYTDAGSEYLPVRTIYNISSEEAFKLSRKYKVRLERVQWNKQNISP